MAAAIRCAMRRPRPGENHGCTRVPSTVSGSGSNSPVFCTTPVVQSSSKSFVKSCAIAADSSVTSTFSSRVQESSVQFVEPVHTALPSRITYLWCIRSGTPGIDFAGTPSDSMSDGSVRGGGGTGISLRWSTL